MGLIISSSYHLNRPATMENQVSPIAKKGVPSAKFNACWFGDALIKPRRRGFAAFSASFHFMAVNEPVLSERPGSPVFDPLFHVQVPVCVATNLMRKVLSPSQKPYTLFLK